MDRFERLASALRRIPGLEVRENEPMKRHTTFRIGGPARLMALPRSRKEAAAAVRAATEAGIAPFFLGNGSNLLVADHGYEGFVLKACGLDQVREVNRRLRAESGITLARLANAALGRGLTGLEFAHGIPGTLGGAVVMNAGAYGGGMVQVLTAVTYLDGAGEEHTLPAAACALTYRHSRFSDRPDWLVLEAELELRPGDGEAIRARMDELAAKRREKQPLEWPSGGSTFKRPEGHFAAALIEGCGLKGVGTDALSVDTLRDQQFLAHKTLLDGGLVILESLCLKKVVGRTDLMLFALPLKFENADGAPVRAIAEFRDFPEEKEMEAL